MTREDLVVALLVVILIIVCPLIVVSCVDSQPETVSITGIVRDADGPVAGAVVRVQTTCVSTTTDASGRFELTVIAPSESVSLTAWAPGYYITGGEPIPLDEEDVELVLTAFSDLDNPDYAWLPSGNTLGEGEDQGCAQCHSREGTDCPYELPVDEWRLDAHSQSAVNPRFRTMYSGTDIHGNQSPATRYGFNRDYGSIPLPPDLSQPYFGPGYKLDFPETAGSCASCHTPAAAVNAAYDTDPTNVEGVNAEGVTCDFCHKVWDVELDPATGLPYDNMPGVLSFEFRRPAEGHQFFAGPLDDVAPGEDTYSALQETSQYCAPCHFGVFWDTVVYNSFGEWLESPYSDPETGQTCQDCHMPHSGATGFALPDEGGLTREPETIVSHRMPGAADEEFLRDALEMTVTAGLNGDTIEVQVNIVNDNTGHHIPTDSPLRHLILLVEARSEDGTLLEQVGGPTVPEWCGVGDPSGGYYAGQPGTAYAKVLQELWTDIAPTGAYWNPTRVLSDNRIAALQSDLTTYLFAAPEDGNAIIDVNLLFRRAYIDLMDQKDWDVPDIVMASQSIAVRDDG
jgi:hypothetical protein